MIGHGSEREAALDLALPLRRISDAIVPDARHKTYDLSHIDYT